MEITINKSNKTLNNVVSLHILCSSQLHSSHVADGNNKEYQLFTVLGFRSEMKSDDRLRTMKDKRGNDKFSKEIFRSLKHFKNLLSCVKIESATIKLFETKISVA